MENDEEEKIVNVDESELLGNPRRFRITKDDIERIGFSDGCVSCNAMRQGKTAQRNSEYCRQEYRKTLGSRRKVKGLYKAEAIYRGTRPGRLGNGEDESGNESRGGQRSVECSAGRGQ